MSEDKPPLLQVPFRRAQVQNYLSRKYIDPTVPRVQQGSFE
jgi:hypothetical protein